ncbi:MAG: class I SAM-dependent methyltransferase [Planctomycetota bacterium]|nr:class I SAM-dependent methyltransferase [Planctomycetota bacterium]
MRWWLDQTSPSSAAAIVPLLVQLLNPSSVLDVGCGTGAWLAAFKAAGVEDLMGLDGEHVEPEMLMIDQALFRGVDLTDPAAVERTFDLVCCLEVAEHLPERSANKLIDVLTTAASTAVLFSAAIPGQGGAGHINEQWPEYWHELFMARGYVGLDVIRPRLWSDQRVAWWYRQNTFLFVRKGLVASMAPREQTHFPLRAIHPELFNQALWRPPLESYSPRQLAWALRRSLKNGLWSRLTRRRGEARA